MAALMIRRAAGPDAFHLIAQHDHAILAAALAERVGNAAFARVVRGEQTLAGVRLHDCGWPLHDDRPGLNKHDLPADVFETTPDVGIPVWTASAERAAEAGPYAQLLVSLHVLALSVFATTPAPVNHEKFDLSQPKNRFAINKFQQREFERQEGLRRTLGLRTDLPLTHGLAPEHADADEDALRSDFRLLQAMDQLSLGLCCTKPPQAHTTDVHPRPGAPAVQLVLSWGGPDVLHVDPWPFDVGEVRAEVPAKRVRAGAWASTEAFQDAYAAAPTDVLTFAYRPRS
ncbi:MAG TPA: DUF3891 family protein [Tepidisphaeraceae bacterium]|nr:DUF3891 family protein [Tepidisphaeraceae bacterium]